MQRSMFWKKKTSTSGVGPTEAEPEYLKQIRRLTQALIVSGAANILLVAFVAYGLFGNGILRFRDSLEPRLWRQADSPAVAERTVADTLRSFQGLSLEQLLSKLEDTTLLEDGLAERDLALGYLTWRHHFDLTQALNGQLPASARELPLRCGDQVTQLVLYPGLSQKQYEAIVHYAKDERWPLTTEGLFLMMRRHQREGAGPDSSLTEAFCLTPEFLTLHKAFARADVALDRNHLIALVLEGSWATFTTASAKLQAAPEWMPAAFQEFLCDYLQHGSVQAARLLAKTHGTHKLTDQTVLTVLQLLGPQSAEARVFATELLNSPRSDLIWKEAMQCGGERVLAKAKVVEVGQAAPAPANKKVYVVREGDSLWKIAKNHHTDVAKLKAHNSLQSDLVRPGNSLLIP